MRQLCLLLLIVVLTGCGLAQPGRLALNQRTTDRAPRTAFDCPVTEPTWLLPPEDEAVLDEPAYSYFFVNDDASIMASAGWAFEFAEQYAGASTQGVKVGWFRPAGAPLEVTGRRLDGPAEPMHGDLPSGYPTRFQASGLYFPTEGCWEVTARAKDSELVFVVRVLPGPAARGQPRAPNFGSHAARVP